MEAGPALAEPAVPRASNALGALGALSALISIAAGAFGAHALRGRLDAPDLQTFDTAARYQLAHGIALVLVAVIAERRGSAWVSAAGWLFLAGTLLFSGSLYALALTGQRLWGIVTPFGGLSFMAGWLCLSVGMLRIRLRPRP